MNNKNGILAKMLLDSINTQFQKNIIDDGFQIGTVRSINPITIEVDGLILYEDNLYINKYLLPWTEECTGLTTLNGNPSHTHGLVYINHPSKLVVGYSVALYGMEWNAEGKTYQKYCVLTVIN